MRHLKNLVLFLSLLFTAVPRLAPALLTASAPAVSVVAPAVSALPAIAGATAIVAALSDDAEAVTISGLNFPSNGQAGGDIRLLWSGANLLPRNEHTAIWRYNPVQQNSYYAVAWHSPNDGSWDYGIYSWGTHPYPVTSSGVKATGASLKAGGEGGPVHYWEEAGLGIADDFLTSPGGSAGTLVVKDRWYVQVRKCRIVPSGADSGYMEHIYIPDLLGNPSFVIRQLYYDQNSGSIPIIGVFPHDPGANPAFYFGASDWTGNGSSNDETPSGKLRGLQLYDAWLDDADIALEAANTSSNSPVTVAGIANVWYFNQDPIPSDVTDKSGSGHNPTWANANRPSQWDSTYAGPVGSFRGSLLGVGK